MKPSFSEKYGQGLDSPVGAVAHKLSNGGQDVLGMPEIDIELARRVYAELQCYSETDSITYEEVQSQLKWWLTVNERYWAEKTTND